MQRASQVFDKWFANRKFWGWKQKPKIVADHYIMSAPYKLILRKLGGFLGLLLVLCFVYHHAQQESVNSTIMSLGFALLLMLPVMPFVILRDLTRQFEYDRHTIRKSSIFGRSKARNLRDIVDIEKPASGFRSGVILCFADKSKMEVGAEYNGFGEFLEFLAKHNHIALGVLTTAQVLPNSNGGYRADTIAEF